MAEETEVKEVAEPEKHTLHEALVDLEKVVQVFAITPQKTLLAGFRFKDAAGDECAMAVTLVKLNTMPENDVVSGLAGEFKEAAEDYRVLAVEGQEAYAERIKKRVQKALEEQGKAEIPEPSF